MLTKGGIGMDYSKMCPKYESAAEMLGKKWTGLIIRVMLGGPKRFKEIKEQIPDMSDKMLTDRMKELESLGILTRTVYPEMPVRIEYELTEKGRNLEDVIQSIQSWGENWV
jgi:DNA-binding HxlR family transcriptional regulator